MFLPASALCVLLVLSSWSINRLYLRSWAFKWKKQEVILINLVRAYLSISFDSGDAFYIKLISANDSL